MKTINKYILGLSVMGLMSCSDFLTVDAPSKLDNDYVFSSKNEISSLLNGVYAQLLSGNTYGNYYLANFCFNSDVDISISSNEVGTDNSYRRFDCTSNGGEISKFWSSAYQGIEYCNNFIDNLQESPLYSEDDPEIMQMLGEAKVIRAMFYHDMVVMFGDIPFSLVSTSNVEDFVMPVFDREEIHKQLIEDLKSIAPYMSYAKDLSDGVERVSKEFCWAMIARMALTCGGYSLRPDKSDPTSYGIMQRPENYLEYYDIAREYCDSVILSNTHSLTKDYRDVFIDECNYVVNNGDDPIFEIPFAINASGRVGYLHGPKGELYEGKATHNWGESNGGARLNAFYRFSFDEKDLRRDYVNGLWYYLYDGTPTILTDYSVFNNKWSKFWNTTGLGSTTTDNTGINYPYMRYADVLLMYAEAVNELEDGVGGENGAKAKDALRQVRERAFRGTDYDLDAYIAQVSVDKPSFLKAVLDERKWEFAGENMRWRDLVRNNMYGEVLYYSFFRYYAVGENAGGTSSYIDMVNEYDGKGDYLEKLPGSMYYQVISNVNDKSVYPNTTLDMLDIYNPYSSIPSSERPSGDDWETGDFYAWWNDTNGCPTDQCLFSFYGYIRGDRMGGIYMVGNGGVLTPAPTDGAFGLPVVRYILPYPNDAIQRSAGVYRNYYGY